MIHELKFMGAELCDAVYSGRKRFEIRLNDRDYKVNDIIKPVPIDEAGNSIEHPIVAKRYRITYVVDEWQGALVDGYCVFSIEPLSNYADVNLRSRKLRSIVFVDNMGNASAGIFAKHNVELRSCKEFRRKDLKYKVLIVKYSLLNSKGIYDAMAELHEKLLKEDPDEYNTALEEFAKVFKLEHTK